MLSIMTAFLAPLLEIKAGEKYHTIGKAIFFLMPVAKEE